jgi:hypothetical protein
MQPDPFRRYAGADLVRLPLPEAGRPLPYWQLYANAVMPPMPLSVASVVPAKRTAGKFEFMPVSADVRSNSPDVCTGIGTGTDRHPD